MKFEEQKANEININYLNQSSSILSVKGIKKK